MHVLIIADIEGSSGCWSRRAAASMTSAWCKACLDMTDDAKAVVFALAKAGVSRITLHDFHRTGYNIVANKMPNGCRVISGYRSGPVPGIGHPGDADVLMMIGMHAASGSNGFLPHTLTSRIASLKVNGHLLSEAQLFSAALFPFDIRPVFFSGCPVACRQAEEKIKGIHTYSIDKSHGRINFDIHSWRKGLAQAATGALSNTTVKPYDLNGPLEVRLKLRDGAAAAAKLSRRWKIPNKGDTLYLNCSGFNDLYDQLLRICYLTPFIARHRTKALFLYRLWGRLGQLWVRTLGK